MSGCCLWRGSQWVAKMHQSCSIVLVTLTDMIQTSIHLECASITIMNMCPRNGPVKSIVMQDHGSERHSHEWRGAVIGAGRDSWQTEHDFTRDSILYLATIWRNVEDRSSWPYQHGYRGAFEEWGVYWEAKLPLDNHRGQEDTTVEYAKFFFLTIVWVGLIV